MAGFDGRIGASRKLPAWGLRSRDFDWLVVHFVITVDHDPVMNADSFIFIPSS